METNFDLPQNYADLGFNLSKVGGKSLALRHQDNLIFIFVSGIDAREDFVSRLCDCYLKLSASGEMKSRN
jgi:hypothetical protein